jgi:homocysteine S-methyltransferase
VTAALELAREVSDLPRIAYPNSGEVWDGAARAWTGDPELPDSLFREWATLATGVGGCCRLGPDTIARIARSVT